MILHTFNSPAAWHQFHSLVAGGDQVLLIEDAVLAAVSMPGSVKVLEADVRARGLMDSIQAEVISDTDFVALCCEADKVCSWSA